MRVSSKFAVASLAIVAPVAVADSLVGEDKILCSAVQVTVCGIDGVCESGLPWKYDVPQFVEIDLKKKQISTTAASGENRSTPIRHLQRENGKILFQGVQNERAFSSVINEEFGDGTFAIAVDGIAINVFSACTPIS